MLERFACLTLLLLTSLPVARAQATDPRPAAWAALQAASSTPLTGSTEAGAVRVLSFRIPATGSTAVEQAHAFVASYGAALGQTSPDQQLVVRTVEKTPGPSQIVSFRQHYKGVPVHGGSLRVGIETEPFTGMTRVIFAAGALLPDPALEGGLDVRPSLAPDACVAAARTHLDRPGAAALGEPKLMVYDARLAGGAPGSHLVWAATMGDGPAIQVFCDAHTGAVVFERPFTYDSLDLWLGLQFPNPQHTFLGDESGLTQQGATFTDAKLEWSYAHSIHNFFATLFGWHGTAGNDNQLQLLVESNTTQFYSDIFGEAIQIKHGYASLDVTSHEYAHGIIHHSSDLDYSFASGALNEGYADAMGVFVDGQDWLLGEDRSGFKPTEIIRDFQDPPVKSQPDQMSEYQNLPANVDHGGVHRNSGILNKAHYLMATGDAFNNRPDFSGVAMGRVKMGTLAFFTMKLLSSSATFKDARAMSITVAQALANWSMHGFVQSDVCAVKNGFAAVELGVGDFNCDGIDDNLQDSDGDFVPNNLDNCPLVWNPDQADWDTDFDGDACDVDFDNDKVPNGKDNCFATPNWDQKNTDKTPYSPCGADGLGDACDSDDDNDGVLDGFDNCPFDCNPGQENGGGTAAGDACDPDSDGDGWYESTGDNCPCAYNPSQAETDGDGLGDACDLCPAAFDPPIAYGAPDWQCPMPRPIQSDSDEDGIGDACDAIGFGEASLFLNGAPYDPGHMPALGGEPGFGTLDGPGGSEFRIPVPLCNPSPTFPGPPELVELVFGNLDPEIDVRLVDDDGLVLGSIRPGPSGFDTRGLRVGPDCARRYFLDVSFRAAFGGPDEFMLGMFYADPATPNPYVTPGLGLPPPPPVPDIDGDGLIDATDNCPDVFDPTGADFDGDDIGDVCDSCTATGDEVCNGLDDDCDGTTDNVAASGPITSVLLSPHPVGPPLAVLAWSPDPLAESYDVVVGDLGIVRSAGGFASAVLGCLADDWTGTSVDSGPSPAAGQALFLLVRGNSCGVPGTWDEGGTSQVGSRDPDINASTAGCSP